MGISARVATGALHPDALFISSKNKLVLTDLSPSPEDRAIALARVTTTLNSSLSMIPSCECGFISDTLGLGIGTTICPRCNSTVDDGLLKTITPSVFISKLPGIESLLQPIFLSHFKTAYSKRGFDALRYFLDPSYTIPFPPVDQLNIPKGLQFFVANIPYILDTLNTLSIYNKRPPVMELLQEYTTQASAIHCNHIYVLNRALVIIDKSPLQVKLQKPLLVLLDVVLSLIALNTRKMSMSRKYGRLGKAICALVDFYSMYFREIMASKTGAVRTSIYAVRGTVAQYAVITSITTHLLDPEEIHLPYTPTLHMLYPQVVGKLIAAGFTQQLAVEYIQRYSHTSNPKLHRYMEEILELDVKGYSHMLFQRFPTLSKGSINSAKAIKVLTNVLDKSIHTSILGVGPSNRDHDGDNMVAQPRPEIPEFANMEMKYNMIDTLAYRKISANFILSKPVVTNILHWREWMLENTRPSSVDVAALYGP